MLFSSEKHKYRAIWGRLVNIQGSDGVVRVKFRHNFTNWIIIICNWIIFISFQFFIYVLN